MHDGVTLRADVYRPDGDEPVPAIVNRTPYDRSFSMTPLAALDPEVAVAAGFALVCQDVRGQFGSDGTFHPFVTEARDGAATLDWVAARPWCSGQVMMAGRSYSGVTQWLAAGERPASLTAFSPVVTGSSYYDGWVYQGGCFQLGFNLFWTQLMTAPRLRSSLGDQFRHLPITEPPLLEDNAAAGFYQDWLAHSTDDDYWRTASIPATYDRVEVPALIVGGWYDLLLSGTLANFRHLGTDAATERARTRSRLLIGPWAHGTTYGEYPDHSFSEFGGEDEVELSRLQTAFFRAELDDADPGPPVRIFVMGANRWRDEAEWPLARADYQPWYLRAGAELAPAAPAAEGPDEYTYDPSDPAPTLGGPTLLPASFMRTNSGPMDQRKVEARDDVLVYSSAPLTEPLEVTGPLEVVLYAATSARDTDWVAKLCDVDAEGVSRIIAEGVLRARYREGFTAAVATEPGTVYAYRIDLVATSNVFAAGHRIRLSVTSSSFPRFDRNTNTGNALGADRDEDLVVAHQRVYHDADRASHILMPVIHGAP